MSLPSVAPAVSKVASQVASLTASPCAAAIVLFARLVTAVRGLWVGVEPVARQRVYYANHCSHGDVVLLWTVLPPRSRRVTRPVAGADYWMATPLRRFIGRRVFRALLIERGSTSIGSTPVGSTSVPAGKAAVERMAAALDDGDSLILFPEGTRNTGDSPLLPFRSGLHHLAQARPGVEFVPVWIAHLNRVLPRGEMVPVPLLCTVSFGPALPIEAGESGPAFLDRAHAALLALAREEQR